MTDVVPCPLAIVAFTGAVQLYVDAPATAAIEYATAFVPAHTAVDCPVIVAGVDGLPRTNNVLNELTP